MTSTALPLFSIDDYTGLVGTGATKLRTSAVAPLVAAARGYATVTLGDLNHLKNEAIRLGLGDLRAGNGMMMKLCASQGDTLVTPLFQIDQVFQSAVHGNTPQRTSVQFRPSIPMPGKAGGKPAKYMFVPGTPIPIDVHPSIPASWFSDPAAVVLSEGTIKIDSAITAICRQHGVTDEELADTTGDPTERLRTILDGLPMSARHLCVSFAGVGNWHKNPELNSLPITGRPVWIAFDKDVDVNYQVWGQAKQLRDYIETKGGYPKLLDLTVEMTKAAGQVDERAGLDDYLSDFGTWADMAERLRDEMPERPIPANIAAVGDWRVNESSMCCEELVPVTDAKGGRIGEQWERRCGIIGWVSHLVDHRSVTAMEEVTGRMEHGIIEGIEQTHVVHLKWQLPHETEPTEVTVTVPSMTLADRPADWGRRAKLPGELTEHPEWPPKPEWLKAIKSHRMEEREHITSFTHMGWVPTEEDGPRFLIGEQCIGPNGIDDAAIPGCTDQLLADASKFGVILPDDEDDARECIRDVIKYQLDADLFTQPGMADLVTAAALRPVVPLPVTTPILLSGPSGAGKSWTAAAIITYWQRAAGTWTNDNLPGSTKDTRAANENTQARAAIWVFDDLAPSADNRQALAEEAGLEGVIRNCHNRSVKRRMSRDMKALEVLAPRALPIVTAENALSVRSVMNRTIHYPFRAGSLGSIEATDAFNEMRDRRGSQSVVTGAALLWMNKQIAEHGYETVRDTWTKLKEQADAVARKSLAGAGIPTRHANLAADIFLGILVLQFVATDLGMTEEAEWIGTHGKAMFKISRMHYEALSLTKPGAALNEALRSALSSGAGYIADANTGGPPALLGDNAGVRYTAQMFGWTTSGDGTKRPRGECIGTYVAVKGREYVLFDKQAAFELAKRRSPALLPPGSKATTSWSSAWDEGIAGGHWKKPAATITVQVSASKKVAAAIRGVPFPVEILFAPDELPQGDGDFDETYEMDEMDEMDEAAHMPGTESGDF